MCGGHVGDQIGYQPIRNPALLVFRKRASAEKPAFRKHRRWLDDLRMDREKYLGERQTRQIMEEIRLKNFKERSTFIRRRICDAIKGSETELTERKAEWLFTAPLAELKRSVEKKPAWSLTKAEGEQNERAQVEELVEFANHLDIARYIDDLEIQQLVKHVKERVSTLESQSFAGETEAAKARRLAVDDMGISQPTKIVIEETASAPVRDESKEEAIENLISESREKMPSFKQIHSKSSLRNVIESMEKKTFLETTEVQELSLQRLPSPKLSTAEGNNVGRLPQEKLANHVSMLPYLHRNPAV
jgi:hypothetical protein